MAFFSLRRWIQQQRDTERGQQRRRPLLRCRPQLEILEDRLAPAVLTVNSLADTAGGGDAYLSLREAIVIVNSPTLPVGLSSQIQGQISGPLHGNGSDTVLFDHTVVNAPIVLVSGQLELSLSSATAAVTIDGGLADVTIDANNASRVLQVDSGVQAAFANLTIANGNADGGSGGGINNAGTLTVTNSIFSGNHADNGIDFGQGGAIYNNGSLTVIASTFTGNNSNNSTGGGGGIFNEGTALTVIASTFTGNHADGGGSGGGAISTNSGTVIVIDSTFSGNSGASGGAIFFANGSGTVIGCTITNNHSTNSGTVFGGGIYTFGGMTLIDTIVAGNDTSGSADINGSLPGGSRNNLIGDGTGMSGISNNDTNGNLVGTPGSPINPLLGALADNGGPTLTYALLQGSPAVKAGSAPTRLATALNDATTTSVVVVDTSLLAVVPSYTVLLLDSEQMLVTSASGNTLTVQRGHNGTTAGPHGATTPVFLATDQRGSPRAFGGLTDIGAYQTADLSVTATPVATPEGTAFSGRVATFTDGGNTDPIGNFTATIHWNDDTADTAGSVSQPGGIGTAYVVDASGTPHTYAEEGSYTFTVTITDTDSTSGTASNTGTATVADAALTGSSAATAGGAEGVTNSSVLSAATFTDANPGDNHAEMTATITWGDDGATSTGTVSFAAGVYTVAGAHTYAEEGSYGFSISVADAGGSSTSLTGTATVGDAALTGSSAATASGTEGATNSSVLSAATFTDAKPGDNHAEMTATITWGDGGDTSTGTVSFADGVYTVAGAHTYAEEGSYDLSISVADAGSSTTITGTATVGDAVLTGSSAATAAGGIEGVSVATLGSAMFTDANTAAPSTDFTVSAVAWGDGSTNTTGLTVSGSGGNYTVNGSHLYADEGTYDFTMTVTDVGGNVATISGRATVADAALTGSSAATAGGTEGAPNSSVLSGATFTDANPGDHSAEMTATINWGDDGATSTGTVSFASGVYTVAGAHTYAEEGSYGFSISVADVGGSSTTITGTATVADAALTGSGAAAAGGTEGSLNSSVLSAATFTDANPGDNHAEMTATIHWGDTQTSAGTVSYLAGVYTVAGAHTYAEEGSFGISISVADVGGNVATISGTATVADAALTGSSAATAGGTEGILNSSALSGATFTDAKPGDNHAEMTATINWGDTQTSAGTVSYLAGVYTVAGAHTYVEEGSFGISISVADVGGNVATISGTATVADATLTGSSAATAGGTEGILNSSALSGATFTDAKPGDNHAEMTATITWGDDGLTSLGTVSYSDGVYTVAGAHSYAEEGSYDLSISVLDAGGKVATITGTATVGDAALTTNAFTPPAATEGAPFSGTAFNFSDANANGTAGDYTAVVVLGDGNTVTLTGTFSADGQIVAHAGGTFDVNLTHTYLEELTAQTFSVTVTDNLSQASASTSTFNVADAALIAGVLTPPVATEGALFTNVVVFHFTDADPAGAVGDYVATVNTGDMTLNSVANPTQVAIVANDGGGFDVQLSYKYLEELTGATFSVSVTDNAATASQSIGTFSVADAALTTNRLSPPAATEGAPFSRIVFSFSDADPDSTASDYTAVVVLGDGNTVTLASTLSADGQIVDGKGGSFGVLVTHTYLEELTNATFSVTVTDHAQSTSASTSTFSVADAALTTNTFTPPAATERAPFSGTVFNFSDADPNGTASDYTAVVILGDGNTVTLTSTLNANGQIEAHAGGTFDVNLTHTYLEELTGQTFSVTVTDNLSQASASTGSFSVADAALSATADDLTPPTGQTEGVAFGPVTVFHFTDADPNGVATDYVATVMTGESTLTSAANPDNVTIVANGGGGFDVLLSYTYLKELTGATFSVSVTDHAATTSLSISPFSVADAALSSTVDNLRPPMEQTEGAAFGPVTVFHFTDADPNGVATDYVATVVTGESTLTSAANPSNVIIAATEGGFDVRLSYTYLEELTGQTFSVSVTDHGANTSQSFSPFSVADAALTTNTFTPPAATEGATFSGTVLNFSDADPNGTAGDYTAVVVLGDGNTVIVTSTLSADGQIVPRVDGTFDVRLSHTYLEELAGQTFNVTVTDHASQASGSTTSFNVADAALTAGTLTPPVATEGAPFSGTVFNFSDADPNRTASDYTAVVVLGDGNSVTLTSTLSADGQIVPHVGGTFDVRLSHTYLEELTGQTFSVTVTDNLSQASASTTSFSVADALLTTNAFTPPVATEGAPFSGTVFNFSDADPNGTASDYTAVVVLGDGNTVTLTSTLSADGQIVANGGTFDVQLSHTYLEELTGQTFSLRVTDNLSQAGASTGTFGVADAALTTNSFTPPLAIEGAPSGGPVFTLPLAPVRGTVLNFSDADPGKLVSDYTAVVVLGDGNTVILTSTLNADGQIVPHVGGTFDVNLTHTYLEELTGKTFSVTVTDHASQTSASTSSFSVADAALTAGTLTPPAATEGAPFSGTVFNFSDADPNGTASDYTAVVVLGDGNTVILTSNFSADGQIVPHAGGTFDVNLTHTYLEELTGQTFSVTVTDHASQASASTTSLNVADAALAADALTPPVATEGTPFSGTVFNFSDADPNGTAADYTAVVVLGDGNTVTLTSTLSADGQIVAHAGGTFDVNLTHTYLEELAGQTFSVTVTDNLSQTSGTTSTFSVADAALTTSSFTPPVATEGAPFNRTVFTFSDADPNATASDYTAVVVLGDGNTVTLTSTFSANGQIVGNENRTFGVRLSHTYLEELTGQTFSVTVTDHVQSASASTSTFSVADAALTTNTLTPPAATEGAVFSGTVFNFSDADPNGTASDYTAVVVLGDGNTVILTSTLSTNGQIVPHVGGTFDVQLSHTYLEEMTARTFSVTVTDNLRQTSASTSTFSVADAALTTNTFTPPVATEAAPFRGTVLNFSDADPNGTLSDYTAAVVLGDGNTVILTSNFSADGQIVGHAGGSFDVNLTHTYLEELTGQTFSVTVTDNLSQTSGSTSTFSVADAILTGSTMAAAGGTEGATNSSVLSAATFTDVNPGNNSADMTATITWGDSGPTSLGTVSFAGGVYTVTATHTYAEEGSYTISINVADVGGQTATITGTATVADAALTGSNAAVAGGAEGASNSSVLSAATFTDANPGDNHAEMTATIHWGDTQTSAGTVSYLAGVYTVAAAHTYAEEGSYAISISVVDHGVGGSTTTITGSATVADAALTGSATAVASGTEGATNSSVLSAATFTDANPGDNHAEMTATIHWGDTQTSAGTVSYLAGVYTVSGTHTYAEEGSFQISINAVDAGGSSAIITGTATVADAVLTGSSAATAGGAAGSLNSSVLSGATFTDANPGDNHAEMTATIHWGDTQTSAGTVSYLAGVYTVNGAHTYSQEINFPISIDVVDAGGSTTTITGTATVATFSDNFNLPDGSPLNSSLWIIQRGNFIIQNGTAVGTTSVNSATARGVLLTNTAVSADFSMGSDTTLNDGGGLVVRYTGSGEGDFYLGTFYRTSTGLKPLIRMHLDGQWITLVTGSVLPAATSGAVEFEVVGSSLKLFFNGNLVAYAYDSRLTSGSVGMRANQGVTWDNFVAVSVPVATVSSLPFSDQFNHPSYGAQLSHQWTDQVGNFTIQSAAAVGTGTPNLSTVNGLVQSDVTVNADFSLAANPPLNDGGGLVARYSGTGEGNCYLAALYQTSTGLKPMIRLHRNGVWTTLVTGAIIPSATSGPVKFQLVGSSLTLFFNNILVAQVTNTALTSGTVGMRANQGVSWSNYSAT